MNRLAEMREYSAAFGGLDDQDFLAAGYTPEEVAAFRGGSQPPSLTPQDRSAMLDQYGTLEVPDYSMRDTATQRVQDALIRNVGMDPYEAGRYARRILGDPSSQNILDGLGLADLTPVGAAFAIEEGSGTTAAGYREGDPLKMALGVLEAGLGVAEAVPLTAAAARGISGMASRMDPNTLLSMVGPPIPPRAAPAPEAAASGIRAFQGSPHDFSAERLVRYPDGRTEFIVGAPDALPDIPAGAELVQDFPLGRMRMDKIGTGEGAQAYGHGLYSAEVEAVAREYRDALSEAPGIRGILPEGRVFNDPSISADSRMPTSQGVVLEKINDYFQENVSRQGLSQKAIGDAINSTEQNIRSRLVQRIRENPLDRQRQIREFGVDRREQAYSSQLDYVASLRNRIDELEPVAGGGRVYEININANPEQFLDFDMPLAGQTPEIQSAIRQIAPDAPGMAQGNKLLLQAYPQPGQEVAGEFLGETATRRLREAGIPGIKFADAGSRGAGGATRNFVVFDENLINIVRKYGIAGAATMLGVTALDVESALADNLPPSEWENIVVGAQ